MRNWSVLITLLASNFNAVTAYAQSSSYPGSDSQDPVHLNDSGYPASNQLNSPPSIPDVGNKNPHDIRKQPNDVAPLVQGGTPAPAPAATAP